MATYHAKLAVYISANTTTNSVDNATLASYFGVANTWKLIGYCIRGTGGVVASATTSSTWSYVSSGKVSGYPYYVYHYSMTSTATSMSFSANSINVYSNAAKTWATTPTVAAGSKSMSKNDSGDGAPVFSAYCQGYYWYRFTPALYIGGNNLGTNYQAYLRGLPSPIRTGATIYDIQKITTSAYTINWANITGLSNSYYYLSATTIYAPEKVCRGYFGVSALTNTNIQYSLPAYVLYQYNYQITTNDYNTLETAKPIQVKQDKLCYPTSNNNVFVTANTTYTKTIKPYTASTTYGIHTDTPISAYTNFFPQTIWVTVSGNTLHKYYDGRTFSNTANIQVNGWVDWTKSATTQIKLYRPYYYQYTFKYDNASLVNNRVRVVFDRQVYPGNPCYIQDTTNGQLIVPTVSSTTINYSAYTSCAPMITGTTLASSTQMPVLIN